MGGARRRPMTAGEGQCHANERGWRGNPSRMLGRQKRPGAFWKWLERWRPNPAAEARPLPWGGFRTAPASSSPRSSASREKHAHSHIQTPEIRPDDFPPLLYFCITVTAKTKRDSQAALHPAARAGFWRPDPHPAPPLEGHVLTKLCHCCQVYTCPCVCFSSGSALECKVLIL